MLDKDKPLTLQKAKLLNDEEFQEEVENCCFASDLKLLTKAAKTPARRIAILNKSVELYDNEFYSEEKSSMLANIYYDMRNLLK